MTERTYVFDLFLGLCGVAVTSNTMKLQFQEPYTDINMQISALKTPDAVVRWEMPKGICAQAKE